MAKRKRAPGGQQAKAPPDLRHLRRETRTALELAVVALAPAEIMDRLAVAAGFLEALSELPTDTVPVVALVPGVVARTKEGLDRWRTWQGEYLQRKIPRG